MICSVILFESLIIRQPTFHQTSLSIFIFFLLLYFHSNISQSLYLSYLFRIFSPRLYTHTHSHYTSIQYPYTPVALSTFIDHLNQFSLSLFISLCTLIHHYVPQLLLHYIISICIIGINMVSYNSHYYFGHSLRLLLYYDIIREFLLCSTIGFTEYQNTVVIYII